MNFSSGPAVALCVAVWLGNTSSAHALTVSIEAAGVQQTSVAGVVTETFNALSAGPVENYSSPIGSFTGGQSVTANVFGGAAASRYYAIGTQSGSLLASLTFASDQSYFGLWWSALDGQNQLEFYDSSAALLGSFRSSDILPLLSSAYYSNPNGGANAGEAYVYLNFNVASGTLIHRVNFRNDSLSSGFEMDNLSILATRTAPPGASVPDTGSPLSLLLGTLPLFILARAHLGKRLARTN